MAIYNTLNWQDEKGLTSYPLETAFEISNFLVDANFIQFDKFIPTLNYVIVDSEDISFSITFDYGEHNHAKFYKSIFAQGEAYRSLKFYQPGSERYLGSLTFGEGANELWSYYVSRKILSHSKFLPSLVRSIRTADAVYTFDNMYGDVALTRSSSDSNIFYNTYVSEDETFKAITFNAVGGHEPKYEDSGALRQINLVGPVDNNINMASNDVIKIKPSADKTALTIGLVSGSPLKDFSVPTLIF
jgi:hypothetical protein